jgi:hypothetical protein
MRRGECKIQGSRFKVQGSRFKVLQNFELSVLNFAFIHPSTHPPIHPSTHPLPTHPPPWFNIES